MSELDDVLYQIEEAKKALKRLAGRSLQDAQTANDTALAVEDIVPVLCQQGGGDLIPVDMYYYPLGAGGTIPSWCPYPNIVGASIPADQEQWEATDLRFYIRFSNSAVDVATDIGGSRIVYPAGVAGTATKYRPKQKDSNVVYIKFRGGFGDNADYTDQGVGATSGSTASTMFTAGRHFIQVLRNSGNWELGTGDGTNASQTTGGTADASLHYFTIRWTLSEVRLLVDDAVVVTKTTNLPTQPLALSIRSTSTSYSIDLVDFFVYWAQE